ncbi:hypothetical protein [Pseudovibrio exalbescens]|uniref:hypothetical protein n=1 Tax=Pseudovibrio exalbescens TaxID=197461 RepID=UPI000C9CD252|nr:hypothetical protein [Pseudovibrio exalbescens]
MSVLLSLAVKGLSFLGGNALDRVLKHLEARASSQNERDRIGAQLAASEIKAELEARRSARDLLLAEQGWWVTAMIRPAFAWPIVLWSGAIVVDSIFQFEWNVASLPEPLNSWAGWIVGAYFLTRPFEKAVRGMTSRRTK